MHHEEEGQVPDQGAEQADPAGAAKAFDQDLVRKYPRANRKLTMEVAAYGINAPADGDGAIQTTFISPHGIEFKCARDYPHGTLLKIHVALPDYWARKQRFVEYGRVDSPEQFRILAKVVHTEEIGKRGKKKVVTVQTVVIDEVDEQVLKAYLQDG